MLTRRLSSTGIEVSAIEARWGAKACFVFDPAGNRIEFWSVDE